MAGSFYNNNNDSLEISELASLNEDISEDFINQLQNQLTNNSNNFVSNNGQTVNENDDSTLFEEPATAETEKPNNETVQENKPETIQQEQKLNDTPEKENINVNTNFDDNFIKKYKAKLNKKASELGQNPTFHQDETSDSNDKNEQTAETIENLTQGNISERPLTQELKDYNDSLDFLDGNVKYSKYVIYIDPQNVDFIDGLTVKERKNLINSILRQQDDIAITKQRFKVIQTVIRHVIVAVLTLAVSIPLVYYAINASLEATIDNHRRSQTNWQTLYKEHGKITQN